MFAKSAVILQIILCLVLCGAVQCKREDNVKRKPNIIVIMADDLGSHDLSLRGSNQILTPNLDALGYQGVILNRHYTAAMCSPSRAAFMSGKYSIHTGLQHLVILADEPRSHPLNDKILSQYLKEAGYQNHIVGKWHLGLARKAFLPTYRGFDSHVGFLGPYIDYFDFTHIASYRTYPAGFDFRRNESLYWDRVGEYATDVLADESSKIILNHNAAEGPLFLFLSQLAPHTANERDHLQTVPEDLAKVGHIKDPNRRKYAAMVIALDRCVGQVVEALKVKGILDNTFILFLSDNGGPTVGQHSNMASNFPLRGQKDSPWEGGLRGTALVWSTQLQKRHYVSEHLTHITDWFPTLSQMAGAKSYKFKKIDGNDIWQTISLNRSPLRREIVHNIDPIGGYTSYVRDGWKYVNGTTWGGTFDYWVGQMPFEESPKTPFYTKIVMDSPVWRALNPYATKNLKSKDIEEMRRKTKINCQRKIPPSRDCNPMEAPCLFYLEDDPCEVSNLAHFRPTRMAVIEKRLEEIQRTMVPPNNLQQDPAANPALHNGIWTWWLETQ
ncbi:arylsulfatase I-like [Lutzomyia longipalpis]|uniref:arylsulfatase I-like n=1 Tax=Lutzomyia longipalpis TaxID=7200 RepID=UPI002483D8EA|nr:arylsulfatase I-like [Lutzomyia longipalpis]